MKIIIHNAWDCRALDDVYDNWTQIPILYLEAIQDKEPKIEGNNIIFYINVENVNY